MQYPVHKYRAKFTKNKNSELLIYDKIPQQEIFEVPSFFNVAGRNCLVSDPDPDPAQNLLK